TIDSIMTVDEVSERTQKILRKKNTAFVFPAEDATNADDVDWTDIEDIVVVDATWTQAMGIYAGLEKQEQKPRFVKLVGKETKFWRYNSIDEICPSHLATIEAIYYVYKAVGNMQWPDDILYAFAMQAMRVPEEACAQSRRNRRK